MARTTILVLLAALAVSPAHASILTFDGIGSNGTNVPNDYGDRITTTIDSNTGHGYGEGNGFTPNIEVEYLSNQGSLTVETNNYGDLQNVLTHSNFGVPGEVVLRPDPGYEVVLNSFDIAAFLSNREGLVRVLDDDDNSLFVSTPVIFPGSGGHTTFPPNPIRSDSALRIEVKNFGDLAIDNVNFDQQLVPEPASGWLLAAACLIGWRRRTQYSQ